MEKELTPNQESVIKLTSENLRKGKRIIKGKILEKSGYAKSTTKRPKAIYESDGVKEGLKPFVDELVKERDKAIKSITNEKRNSAGYKDLISSIDTLTKNIELLTGNPTDRTEQTPIDLDDLKNYIKWRKQK